ncbi:MAG TPA: HAMP domain-containing histidine kinase [Candidatus Coprousia avicola]|nr:HAMP domain-containing histidine kinase [Candidatus Coprousia avicola]
MDSPLILLILLALGIGLGALLAGAGYLIEVRHLARLLRERDPESNERIAAGTMPGMTELAAAINGELDRGADAHVRDMRHQQEFQRDLSALSHDIRTPLMGAKGYLQLAADETDPERRAHELDMAAARIDATTELLDQLFAYTKSTDPDLSLELQPVALKTLVEESLLDQYPTFAERGWEPSLAFEDEDVRVMADREALVRILQNLVVNALRHGAGAPTVAERASEDAIELVVSNPVECAQAIDAERLFERFYQVDATRRAAGSGLGLAVAANLARAMGAAISARVDGDVLAIALAFPRGVPYKTVRPR